MKSEERIKKYLRILKTERRKTPVGTGELNKAGDEIFNEDYIEIDAKIVALEWALKND